MLVEHDDPRAALERLYQLRDLLRRQSGAVILDDLLPHQLPPGGEPGSDWDGWLIQGGRGSGKTAGVAAYVTAHVEGPPCMDGPMPHKMALVAPTLGDADESAERHPVSLKSLRPEFRVSTSREGTVGKWPNGSTIKLFGTNTRRDVDRLRAGGNNCLSAGTPVLTDRGEMPIELVRPGDRVMTRNGWRRVLRAGITGVRSVITVRAGDHVLVGTPDHPVWTGSEWKPLGLADTIAVWHPSDTADTLSTSVETDTGSRLQEAYCIGWSTNWRSAPSRTAGTSTTSTTTKTTTPPVTSSLSTRPSTLPATPSTARRTGIRLVDKLRGLACRKPSGRASGVATHIDPEPQRPSGAPLVAPDTGHARGSGGCARCVAEHGKPSSAQPQRLVVLPVERRSQPGPARDVYDLQVEHDHEYVAGGMLVGNCLVWLEELAAWPLLGVGASTDAEGNLELAEYDPFAMLDMGLRIGPNPHWVGSTTPKAYPAYRKIVSDPRIKISHGTMHDNPYLVQSFKDRIMRRYGGTSLGAQEIEGILLDEVRGALWTLGLIEHRRRPPGTDMPAMSRVVVGVDPSGGRDTVGIVAAGLVPRDCPCDSDGPYPHVLVLGDWSETTGSPEAWSKRVVEAYDESKADRVVGERNYGGAMVESTIRTQRRTISYKDVTASRGKAIRAEPVVALYEQGRVHHVGRFADLETEMVTWVPAESKWSPNRLDALVWAITELAPSGPSTGYGVTAPGR